jgi:hypothetical protein
MIKTIKFFKVFGILIGLLIFLRLFYLASYYVADYIRIKTFKPPEKLENIPNGAVWKGGVNGGEWFFQKSKSDSIFNIQIFNDKTGKLVFDSSFIAKREYKKQIDTINNIVQHIIFFDGQEIHLDLHNEYESFNLILVSEFVERQKNK